jgi:serine/threonine protein kinase
MNSNDEDDRTLIRPLNPPTAEPAAPEPTAPPVAQNDNGNALPLGTRLGEFEIIGVLGEGGFGIVYLAHDHSLQRRVALKEYLPSGLAGRSGQTQVVVKSERHRETYELGLRSFVNEAQLLAQFDHPSLVKVYRFWEANGSAYMVMPFYQGVTLRDHLREIGGAPDEATLLGLLAPLTQALAVIHSMQCFHRDIAPDNIILLAGSGRPLLLDFGAARRVIGDMTQALTVILKPGYAPLEQYAEIPGMKQGAWTDIYALGAVVYNAITGRTPPPAVGRMVNDTCKPLIEVAAGRYSERFLSAIDRTLRVRPEDRTQSIDEFRADIGLADAPDTGRPDYQVTQIPTRREAQSAPSGAPARRATLATPTTPTTAGTGAGEGKSSKLRLTLGMGACLLALGGYGAYRALNPSPLPASAKPPGVAAPPTSGTMAANRPPNEPTAVVPPAAAPTATASSTTQPADEFEQVIQGQAAGFEVKASPAQGTLRIDKDRLRFSVESARDGFVYVIAEDPDGSTTLLYPNAKVSDNRIRARQTLSLPQNSWPVVASPPAGEERFLVLVSADKRDYAGLGQQAGWFISLPNTAQDGAAALLGRPLCATDGCAGYGATRFTVAITQ